MPKMKTRSGAAKRFKKTASGRIKYKHSFKGHILEKKTTKRKRNLRKKGIIDKSDEKRINSMI